MEDFDQEQEERDFHCSTEMEVVQAEVADLGSRRLDQQWILSDRDAWFKNPYYEGPDQPHPEFDE